MVSQSAESLTIERPFHLYWKMNEDICICIPTLNERGSIGSVIQAFHEQQYTNILVIDGGSTDGTQSIARDAGAKVREQTWEGGKGAAMREAMEVTSTPIVVFVDGDGTYEPKHTQNLVNPIQNGDSDHVLGIRFADLRPGSMSRLHRFGNRALNAFFAVVQGHNVSDVLTGFRAISREAYEELELDSRGFGIETELTARSLRAGHTVTTTPTTYYARTGESELNSFYDGTRIAYRIIETRIR